MCILVNMVFCMFIGMLNIPLLFLDTVGTVLDAVVLGPLWLNAVWSINFHSCFYT